MRSRLRSVLSPRGGLALVAVCGALIVAACTVTRPFTPLSGPARLAQMSETWVAPPQVVEPSPVGEVYAHVAENSFQDVAKAPLSTFSIDVDTASYSNVRRFLHQGTLPPPDAVRIEEMINYFTSDYANPEGAHPLAITTDLATCPWNGKHLLARIAIRAKSIDAEDLPPRNFVFLIDTSGSMADANKLPLLKTSLQLLIDRLRPSDRVAIVSYADGAEVVLPSTRGNKKEKIKRAIDQLQANGSTNGGQGIQVAYRIAKENFIQGGLNRVILGTDGDFNVGVSTAEELVALIEKKRKTGVFLSVLGMGAGNLKAHQMEQLAHHGNGQYAYLDSQAEAYKLFVEQGGALLTIAKDVKIQVELNPARVSAYRLIGYENRVSEHRDFNNDQEDAGDVGAGHQVTALYEIVPGGNGANEPGVDPLKYEKFHKDEPLPAGELGREWLTVKLRYKDPEKDTSRLIVQTESGEPVSFAGAPKDFQFAASVAAFGMVLRGSTQKGSASLEMASEIARRAKGADRHGHRGEFLKLVETAKGLQPRTE